MLETGTSGLMSGEGKRIGRPVRLPGTAPFLDSTPDVRRECVRTVCPDRAEICGNIGAQRGREIIVDIGPDLGGNWFAIKWRAEIEQLPPAGPFLRDI